MSGVGLGGAWLGEGWGLASRLLCGVGFGRVWLGKGWGLASGLVSAW